MAMKILFVAANPISSSRLALDEEVRRIQAEIVTSKYRDDIVFQQLGATRPTDLIRALNREQPDIVHFSGHGSKKGELVFVANDGKKHPISPKELADLFGTLTSPPKLVVLNACYSFQQVNSLATAVDVVIGLPEQISDEDAIVFSGQFYGALSEGVSIFNSYRQAIIGTSLINKNCWESGSPQIMNRPGTNTDTVLVAPHQPQSNVHPNPSRRLISDRWAGRDFIRSEFSDFCEKHNKIAVVLVDINGMHSINTRHGRRVGDRVIAETLLEIEEKSKSAIVSGICGDDTFFCVYENDSRSEVMGLARKLMVDIETHDWGRISLGLFVRVEGGFAIWQKDEETPTETVVRAAAGLKRAQADSITFTEGTKNIARNFLDRLTKNRRELSEELLGELFS
jgi:diguanylate cyclase (GGDEF)-like protein